MAGVISLSMLGLLPTAKFLAYNVDMNIRYGWHSMNPPFDSGGQVPTSRPFIHGRVFTKSASEFVRCKLLCLNAFRTDMAWRGKVVKCGERMQAGFRLGAGENEEVDSGFWPDVSYGDRIRIVMEDKGSVGLEVGSLI